VNSPETRGSNRIAKPVIFICLVAIVFFQLSTSIALALGLFVGIFLGNPFSGFTRPLNKYLLQAAIIGLGFGMNFTKVIEAGKDGFIFTIISISLAIGLGYLLGRWLRVGRIISYLISIGTAICGGSAIAAVSQVVEADEHEISVSIGIVFILNALALFIFPPAGHLLGLSQQQFGLWCAIAIHDTSSVVGAAAHYGNEALMTATTVKLARALWIIPVALLSSFIFKKQSRTTAFPWFIIFFVIASLMNTYFVFPEKFTTPVLHAARMAFSLTLFFIGTTISPASIRQVGLRPFLQGVFIWIAIIAVSLLFILKT